ncbi:MAG: HEAT repeat domain-containing protein [bacterium]
MSKNRVNELNKVFQMELIREGLFIDEFKATNLDVIKSFLVKNNYYHEYFKTDKSPLVKSVYVKKNKFLDVMISSKDSIVCKEFAKHYEFAIDHVDSNDTSVRATSINTMVKYMKQYAGVKNDDIQIRVGFFKEILGLLEKSNDEVLIKSYIKNDMYVERYKNTKILDIKVELAKNGYYLDDLIKDKNSLVRVAVAKYSYEHALKLKDDIDTDVKEELVNQGIMLDKFIKDESVSIRLAVAKNKYGLDILKDDPSPLVRKEVLKITKNYEEFINDSDEEIRILVVRAGFGHEELQDDDSESVREEIASLGSFPDKYINDSALMVKRKVIKAGYHLDTKDEELLKWVEFYANQQKEKDLNMDILKSLKIPQSIKLKLNKEFKRLYGEYVF